MAIRDKLKDRAQPHIQPGETVRHVFVGQTGPTPWLAGAFGAIIYMLWAKFRAVAVTEGATYVFRTGAFRTATLKELIGVLPRQPLGPTKGLWAKIQLGPERMWVNKRFQRDVAAADADLGYGAAPYPGAAPAGTPGGPAPGQVPGPLPSGPPPAQSGPPPNWYPDPQGQARLRYWDGARWTDHTQT